MNQYGTWLQELFIGKLDLAKWLAIRDLDDLKEKLRGVIAIIIVALVL